MAVSAVKFAEAFNGAQKGVVSQGSFGLLGLLLPAATKQKQHIKYVHEFVDSFVENGLARKHELKHNPSGRYVFLNELVQRTDDKIRIRSELINILLAGRDTTASLLSKVWHTLSQRPDIFAKRKAEIDETLGGERPPWTQLKDLKYLRAVLNESLHLYQVVPTNSRQATADTTLPLGGGPDGKSPIFIQKDQVVGWSVYTMHRRTDFYASDAEEFRPKRWLGEKGSRRGWEYLPFNGRPGICPDQQFALTDASYTTIRLPQEFKGLESRDPEPWTEWLTPTCTGFNGCKSALTPA